MEVLQSRIDSFAKSKRVKGSSKSSKIILKWPHPPTFKANPEALAEAGFYYNPSIEDRDSVACFECGKQLSEWEEGDDPFDIHWTKCGDKCNWAAVRCGLRGDMDHHERFVFPDKTRLPGSKKMEKARLRTFAMGDGWVHDQIKNHGANSRKMAQAGFMWTPQLPGDDLATCVYCSISLGGWEKDDDPMEEHRKRVKPGTTCPFFAYNTTDGITQTPSVMSTISTSPTTRRLTRSTSAKPPSKTQSKPPSRSVSSSRLTRGNKDTVQLVKDFDGSGEDDELDIFKRKQDEDDLSDLVKKPAATGKTRKSSRAPSARRSTRSSTRSQSQPVSESQHTGSKSHIKKVNKILKDVEEEDEIAAEPPSGHISEDEERPAPTRSRVSHNTLPVNEEPQPVTESQHTGSKSQIKKVNKVLKDVEEEDEIAAEPPDGHISEDEDEERPAPTREEEKTTLPMNEEPIADSTNVVEEMQATVPEQTEEYVLQGVVPQPLEEVIHMGKTSLQKVTPPHPTAKTPKPQILPALSRVPFMPLQTLTEAELDMTIEEWIRYQMEIEFDKLKRDGERELARFRARAKEVRKMIEGL